MSFPNGLKKFNLKKAYVGSLSNNDDQHSTKEDVIDQLKLKG